MKKLLSVLAATMLMASCTESAKNDNVVTITGKVQFPDNKYNMAIVKRNGFDKVVLDSCKVNEDGTYKLQFEVKEPGVYLLDCQKWQNVNFWGEDEDLVINFRGQDTAKIKIKNPPYVAIQGGPKNELMNLNNWDGYRGYQLMIGVSQGVYRIPGLDADLKQETSMAFYDMLSKESSARIEYLVENYGHLTSVLALVPRIKNNEALVNKTLAKLEENHPNYAPVAALKAQMAEDKAIKERLAVGKTAPEFSYATPDKDQKIGPQDYKGKYLVLDFWASWCGPCRAEIPHLKELYEEYGDKDVAFLSVSIDKKESDWLKALKEEAMPWKQIQADNAGKDVMKSYQFSGIPHIVVLDKEGNIVGTGLRGTKLKETIAELVEGKTKKSVAMPAMGM
ncbi:MAG: TlpA family protein disulfide reductase [Marinifilaceae bacterium]